jgi:hypothetical protein
LFLGLFSYPMKSVTTRLRCLWLLAACELVHAQDGPLVAGKPVAVVAAPASIPASTPASAPADTCTLFPETVVFKQRIDDVQRFPAHARSSAWLALVGGSRKLHADWGSSEDAAAHRSYYGIPYNRVEGSPGSVQWLAVSHEITDVRETTGRAVGVPEESDCAVPQAQAPGGMRLRRGCDGVPLADRRFPFPPEALLKAEHGLCNDPQACGDRHILVWEQGAACRLWESYFAYKVQGHWQAYSTAAWELRSNDMRPSTWTSADAAGLPILPLLARVDEASAGEVRHALRVTFDSRVLDRRFVWPASHGAGQRREGAIPFGSLLRLRADFEIPRWWTGQAQALARAMKAYGLYVADIGADFFVQGEPSVRWNALTMAQLQSLRLEQFEFVDLQAFTGHARFRADSYQAAW